MRYQRTIRRSTVCQGIGLHTGQPAKLRFVPAPVDTGIVFIRKVEGRMVRIPAKVENVVSTNFCTVLGCGGEKVQTVEHLLAALSSLRVDNLFVEVEGPEIPIMDGSAGPFVELLQKTGLKKQGKIQAVFSVNEPILIREESRWIHIAPSEVLSVTYTMPFEHPRLGVQIYSFEDEEGGFEEEIAQARTFGFLKDVEQLRSAGLIRGGSLKNAIVIDEHDVINEEGFRFSDELVRHKVLDLIGDLALLGQPLVGKITVHQGGHSLHTRLVSTLIEQRSAGSAKAHLQGASLEQALSPFPPRMVLEPGLS